MDGSDSPRSGDPAIKLFGREIPLPESQIPAKLKSMETQFGMLKMDKPMPFMKQEQQPSTEPRNAQHHNSSNSNDDHQTAADGPEREKLFKKPDKILPCPRCNSLDTKFCYFNNYNVNQPRYYCKNCQRYWTAGGTMRNVPVGAGRRRNKQFASQYRQILDGSAVSESPESANDQTVTFLKFGSEIPPCESMDEKENQQQVSAIRSSHTNTQNSVPFYPVPPPWVFPLNPIWNNVATSIQSSANSNANVAGIHTTFPQNIPLQFVPVSCLPILGNLSWSGSNGDYSLPALGKHSREPGSVMEEQQSDKNCLVPKSLRIDDCRTAVSTNFPVWVTTGLGTMAGKESKGAILKEFESKLEETHVLEANPAAFSRSQTFQERT